MTKRERQYHLLRKLFKPCIIPFCGTQMVSQVRSNITIADIEKCIKELKASMPPEPPKSIFDIQYLTPVPWDDYEIYLEREKHKRMFNLYFK